MNKEDIIEFIINLFICTCLGVIVFSAFILTMLLVGVVR